MSDNEKALIEWEKALDRLQWAVIAYGISAVLLVLSHVWRYLIHH